jgi:putative flippase GtrA
MTKHPEADTHNSAFPRKFKMHFQKLSRAYRSLPISLKRFAVTGTLTVALDAIVYASLVKLGGPIDGAKALGLIAATIFAYFVNRFWAFNDAKAGSTRIVSFLSLYAAAIVLNVVVNRLSLHALGQSTWALIVSWFLATGSSSVFNYIGMRYVVFRR